MTRLASCSTLFALVFAAACGTTPSPSPGTGDDDMPPPDPTDSVLEKCIADGGKLGASWSTDNQHGPVHSIAVRGTTIIVGSEDGSVKSWDVEGTDVGYGRFVETGPIVSALAFAGDDRLIGADASGHLQQWKMSPAAADATIPVAEYPLDIVATDVTGEIVAVANGLETGTIQLVDRATNTATGAIGSGLWGVGALTFAHGQMFSAGHWYGYPSVERRGTDPATIMTTPTDAWVENGTPGHVTAIGVDAGATTLVIGGDEFVAVMNPADLHAGPTFKVAAPGHHPVGIALLPGKQLFATAGSEGTLQLWRADTAEHVATLAIAVPVGIGVNAAGNTLYTSGPDGIVRGVSCKAP